MILTDRASSPRLLTSPILRAVRTAPQPCNGHLVVGWSTATSNPCPAYAFDDVRMSGAAKWTQPCPGCASFGVIPPPGGPWSFCRRNLRRASRVGIRGIRRSSVRHRLPASGPSKPNRRRVLTRGLPLDYMQRRACRDSRRRLRITSSLMTPLPRQPLTVRLLDILHVHPFTGASQFRV